MGLALKWSSRFGPRRDIYQDEGAGIGNLTRTLCPRRKRYFATNLDAEHLARLATNFALRPNPRFLTCDLENSEDFRKIDEDVDSVVCLNVLEHVEDDLPGLSNIYSVLQPGGRAVILVPQGMSVY